MEAISSMLDGLQNLTDLPRIGPEMTHLLSDEEMKKVYFRLRTMNLLGRGIMVMSNDRRYPNSYRAK